MIEKKYFSGIKLFFSWSNVGVGKELMIAKVFVVIEINILFFYPLPDRRLKSKSLHE